MKKTLEQISWILALGLVSITGTAFAMQSEQVRPQHAVVAMSINDGTSQQEPPVDCKKTPDDPKCKDK